MNYIPYIIGFVSVVFTAWRFAWEYKRLRIFAKTTKGYSYVREYDKDNNPIGEHVEFEFISVELVFVNNSTRPLTIVNLEISSNSISFRDKNNIEQKFLFDSLIKIQPWDVNKIGPIPIKDKTDSIIVTITTSRYTKRKKLKIPI